MKWTLQNYHERVIDLARNQEVVPNSVTADINECLGTLQEYAFVEESATITLHNGVSSYDMPADWYSHDYAYRQDAVTDEPTEYEELANHDRTSKGVRFRLGKVIVQPTPGATDEGKTLYLDYFKRVGRTSDSGAMELIGDVPNIPEEFHDLPFLFACMRAKQRDEEFGDSRDFAVEYNGRLQEFVKARKRRGPGAIRIKVKW